VSSDKLLSIYIHIPFCRTRCYYCDFNTTTGTSHLIETYIDALIAEMKFVSGRMKEKPSIHTIFFGGGTPSIIPANKIVSIIKQVRQCFPMIKDPEISMEINPIHLTHEYMKGLENGGVNRVSFGMQSASIEELRMLGRKHNFEDVIQSVTLARKISISNINLDIIFGLPGQTLESFERTLETAVQIQPPHLSLYALTVEEGTPLATMIESGEIPNPDSDIAGDMYETAMKKLAEFGYQQYEISNWAIDQDHQCKHNLQYWMNREYLGFGAGAHSHYNQWRWENTETLLNYIQKMKNPDDKVRQFSPASSQQIELTTNDDLGETMIMGLRLTEDGIGENEFLMRFGVGLEEIYSNEIKTSILQNLLEWVEKNNGRHLRLTQRGKLLGNQVFMRFLKDQ